MKHQNGFSKQLGLEWSNEGFELTERGGRGFGRFCALSPTGRLWAHDQRVEKPAVGKDMLWEYGSEVRLAHEALDRAQVPQKERATRAASGEQGLMTPMSFVSGQGGKGAILKPKLRSAGADVCLGREFGQDARGIQCRGPYLNPTGAFEVSS